MAPSRPDLLSGCDERQRQAITTEAAPLCIIAPAGSGKTRVLTRRIAWRVAEGTALAPRVLALTFTRKAARELRDRVAALGGDPGVTSGTFHALALAELRRLRAERGEAPPVLLESKMRLLTRLLPSATPGRDRRRTAELRSLADEIEWAKARAVPPEAYVVEAGGAGREPGMPLEQIAESYRRYERDRRRRGVLDFDDLLWDLATLIERDDAARESVRFRYRHLFVDEFQDTTPSQRRLLTALLGARDDLCVVGDPDQAIYSWNGADPNALNLLREDYPSLTVLRLTTNYRSSPQILALAGAVLERRERSEEGPAATRPDGAVPTIVAYESDDDEIASVAAALRLAHRPGRTWSQMAVLARTNAQLRPLDAALGSLGIPRRLPGAPRWFDRALLRIEIEALEQMTPVAATERLETLTEAGLADGADPAELDQLIELVAEFCRLDGQQQMQGLSSWLHVAADRELAASGTDGVQLLTFHRAKGLEWPVVFVIGLEQGLVPIARAVRSFELEEERRLLHVALTRAGEELSCSWARVRTIAGRPTRRAPSPYLAPVEAAQQRLKRATRPSPELLGAGLKSSREALAATAPRRPDRYRVARRDHVVVGAEGLVKATEDRASSDTIASEQALARLTAWRRRQARAALVEEQAILDRHVLAALAAARPHSMEELSAVPGLGPTRARVYGTTLLELLADDSPSSR
jgi:DNA helicase-2/ATP-dependent DNA helicase PcrA